MRAESVLCPSGSSSSETSFFSKRAKKIPADGVLLSGKLSVDQSALNGESAEAEKLPLSAGGDWDLMHKNQLFRGSIVSAGEGVMRVERGGR